MVWKCNICEHINAQSTWCEMCFCRWDSKPGNLIKLPNHVATPNSRARIARRRGEEQGSRGPADRPASARSAAGARMAQQEASNNRLQRPNSRPPVGADQSATAAPPHQLQEPRKPGPQEPRPAHTNTPAAMTSDTHSKYNYYAQPPRAPIATWDEAQNVEGLTPPVSDEEEDYPTKLKNRKRMALDLYRLAHTMNDNHSAQNKHKARLTIAAVRRKQLAAKTPTEQLKDVDKEITNTQLKLTDAKTIHAELQTHLDNTHQHINALQEELQSLHTVRQEVRAQLDYQERAKEQKLAAELKAAAKAAGTPASAARVNIPDLTEEQEAMEDELLAGMPDPYGAWPGLATSSAPATSAACGDTSTQQQLSEIRTYVDTQNQAIMSKLDILFNKLAPLLEPQNTPPPASPSPRPPTTASPVPQLQLPQPVDPAAAAFTAAATARAHAANSPRPTQRDQPDGSRVGRPIDESIKFKGREAATTPAQVTAAAQRQARADRVDNARNADNVHAVITSHDMDNTSNTPKTNTCATPTSPRPAATRTPTPPPPEAKPPPEIYQIDSDEDKAAS